MPLAVMQIEDESVGYSSPDLCRSRMSLLRSLSTFVHHADKSWRGSTSPYTRDEKPRPPPSKLPHSSRSTSGGRLHSPGPCPKAADATLEAGSIPLVLTPDEWLFFNSDPGPATRLIRRPIDPGQAYALCTLSSGDPKLTSDSGNLFSTNRKPVVML